MQPDGWYRVIDKGRPKVKVIHWIEKGRDTVNNNRVEWMVDAGFTLQLVEVLTPEELEERLYNKYDEGYEAAKTFHGGTHE